MFSTQSDNCIPINFVNIYDIILLIVAEVEEPKIGISGKGLNTWLYSIKRSETTAIIYPNKY